MSGLSRLGFGVTGPHATRLVSADATVRLIREAIDLGVTTFDTGPMYGGGEGERRLGLALKGVPRDSVFVITKARTWMPNGAYCPPVDVQLRDSLKRLGLSHVDALLLHGPAADQMGDGVADDLRVLRACGGIRHAGVCGRGAERSAMVADVTNGDIYGVLMTPLDDPALLARAAARNIDVIAIETMRARRRFRAPRALADFWYLARDGRDAFAGGAPEPGLGVAAALALPGVKSAVVTTTRLTHLQANARDAGLIPPTG